MRYEIKYTSPGPTEQLTFDEGATVVIVNRSQEYRNKLLYSVGAATAALDCILDPGKEARHLIPASPNNFVNLNRFSAVHGALMPSESSITVDIYTEG